MKTSCPFIYTEFRVEESVSKTKPFEIRIDCYEDKCPTQFWEPLKCINPSAPEDQQHYLGGHCKWIVQICENCKDLHKCKKSGENKDSCRQGVIDSIFRVCEQPAKPEPPTSDLPAQPHTPRQPRSKEVTKDITNKEDLFT